MLHISRIPVKLRKRLFSPAAGSAGRRDTVCEGMMTTPDEEQLRALLRQAKTIAIVGAKDKAGQPVDRVGRYLIDAGYRVLPVHPKRTSVWGLPAFPALADVGEPVDVVNLFRAPEYCPGHAQEALRLSPLPRLFWMQLGITSPEAAALLARGGVPVVENACIMVEHARLFGSGERNVQDHSQS